MAFMISGSQKCIQLSH